MPLGKIVKNPGQPPGQGGGVGVEGPEDRLQFGQRVGHVSLGSVRAHPWLPARRGIDRPLVGVIGEIVSGEFVVEADWRQGDPARDLKSRVPDGSMRVKLQREKATREELPESRQLVGLWDVAPRWRGKGKCRHRRLLHRKRAKPPLEIKRRVPRQPPALLVFEGRERENVTLITSQAKLLNGITIQPGRGCRITRKWNLKTAVEPGKTIAAVATTDRA